MMKHDVLQYYGQLSYGCLFQILHIESLSLNPRVGFCAIIMQIHYF